MFYLDARGVYRVRAWDRLDWLDYGFGTRLCRDWPPGPAAIVKQIHSNHWICADGRTGVLGRADALLSRTPGTWVAVRTADCVPVLIADDRQRAVAVVHAGWRGTSANIAGAAVEGMQQTFGSVPKDLLVAIGPAVCGRCYEVGPEVAREFMRWFPERDDLDGRATIDLTEANRRQFEAAGVSGLNIVAGAPCTLTGAAEFFSHRREPENKGRMVSAISVRSGLNGKTG